MTNLFDAPPLIFADQKRLESQKVLLGVEEGGFEPTEVLRQQSYNLPRLTALELFRLSDHPHE